MTPSERHKADQPVGDPPSPADDERPPPSDLEQVIDRLAGGADHKDPVTIGRMLDSVGRRSFGPLLLVAGLISLSPLSGIPGMPSIMAVIVLAIAGQLLLQREYFWVPSWITRRSISRHKFDKALKWIRPVARFIDRFLRPRWTLFTDGAGTYLIAFFCTLIALTMPPLELLPFMATTAGAALTVFGLALIAHDGLLALVAIAITAGATGFVLYQLI